LPGCGSYHRPGEGKDAVDDAGGKSNEADAEHNGQQELESAAYVVFVQGDRIITLG